MKYKAILFDLDGTLLDTLEDMADALNRTMDRFQLPHRSLRSLPLPFAPAFTSARPSVPSIPTRSSVPTS